MLEILRNIDSSIKAVIEYYIVNSDGSMNDKGEYCWISEMEVSPQYRNNGCLGKFVRIITEKYPQLQFGYFWREKYKTSEGKWRIKLYTKKQWLKLIGGVDDKHETNIQ